MAAIAGAGGADLPLVENGEPRAVIVTADTPSPSAPKSSAVLREYIGKLSGAQLEVTTESESPAAGRILVGHTVTARRLNVPTPSGFTSQPDEEGFVIKTVGQDLILAGNEDWRYRGTKIAVNKFLKSLVCRWYFANEFGKVVPTRKHVHVHPIDRRKRPSFRIRSIWHSGWTTMTEREHANFRKWGDLNNMNRMPRQRPHDGGIRELATVSSYLSSHPHILRAGQARPSRARHVVHD